MSSSSHPLVSIVTPAYNQACFLAETIESVLGQDYPRIEYLVIDDGSTDETRTVLRRYDGRIAWHFQVNQGQTATINKGWEMSTGDILIWLNSDDTLAAGAVSAAVSFLNERPDVAIVFGDTLFTDSEGKPLYRSRPLSRFDYERFVLECENPIPQPSAFMRRRVLQDVHSLDAQYRYFMDWDLWLRAGIRHRIHYAPLLLSTYRLHPESNTVSQQARVAPELAYMYRKYFGRDDLPDGIRKQRRRALANMFFTTGGYYSRGGQPAEAAKSALRALRVYPELVARASMLRKLFFCLFGASKPYRTVRSWRRSSTAGPEWKVSG